MQTILPNKSPKPVSYNLLIQTLVGLLLLLLPVFFLPITADAINFTKVYLVMFVSLVALVVFFWRAFKARSLKLLHLNVYLGVFVLILVAGLSVIFSQNKQISLLGSFGNYETAFLFLVALSLLVFVVSNLGLSTKKLLGFFLFGVTLSTLISFLPFYGLKLPFFGNVGREFSLVGNSTSLMGLQVVAVLSSFYLLCSVRESNNKKSKLFYAFILTVNIVYLLGALNILAVLITLVAFVYLIASNRVDLKRNIEYLLPILGLVAVLTFVNLLPQTRSVLGIDSYNQSYRLPIQESWWVSADTIRNVPLTGSGLGTYVTDFSRYRPTTLNATDAWGVRALYPFNEIFLWLSTAGIIGLLGYIFFWLKILKDTSELDSEKETNFILSSLIFLVLVVLVLLGYNLILTVFLFVLYGLVISRLQGDFFKVSHKYVAGSFLAVAVALLGGFLYLAYTRSAAQYLFGKSLAESNLVNGYNLQKRALRFDPREDIYRRQSVLTGLDIARRLSQQEGQLSESDANVVKQVLSEAVLDARRLTELINPLDVANWEIRGIVYNSLIGLDKNAYQFAVGGYTNALNLEPTNPKLWLTLGQLYYAQEDYRNAAQSFARAVQLKNDYTNAYYNLGASLRELGDYINAVTQTEIALRLIPQDSDDYERVKTELDDLRKLADEQKKKIQDQQARAKAQQQSQIDLPNNPPSSGEINTNKSAQQEPLAEPTGEQSNIQVEPKEGVNLDTGILGSDSDLEKVKGAQDTAEPETTPKNTE